MRRSRQGQGNAAGPNGHQTRHTALHGLAGCSSRQSALLVVMLACAAICRLLAAQSQAALPAAPKPPAAAALTSGDFPAIRPSETAALPEVRALLARGAWTEAGQRCREALAANPASADAEFLLGYALFHQGKAAESLRAYTAGAALRRPQVSDLMAVGADYVLLGDYRDADRWFTRVTEWTPGNALAWYYRGRAEYSLEEFATALTAYQHALAIEPGNVRAEDNLGLAFQVLGNQQQARAAFESAIRMESARPTGYSLPFLNLGVLLAGEGEPAAALPYLEKAVALSPANPRAHEQLARVYDQLGEEAKAESELRAALTYAANSTELHFLLGRVYRKEGKGGEAAAEFQRATELGRQQTNAEVPTRVSAPPQ